MSEQFKIAVATVTSTNDVTLLQSSTVATAMVRSITLCNQSTSATTSADVKMYIAEETAAYFLFRYTQITASQTIMPLSTPVVVTAGNSLRISGGSQNIDATATYLDFT